MKKHKRKLTPRLTIGQPSVLCACDKMPEINCLQGEKVSGVEDHSSLTCGLGPMVAQYHSEEGVAEAHSLRSHQEAKEAGRGPGSQHLL